MKQEKNTFRYAPQWACRPYVPADIPLKYPYICLMSPGEHHLTLEWLDDRACRYEVVIDSPEGEVLRVSSEERTITVEGLESGKEYTVTVHGDGRAGDATPFCTGDYKGKVVNYLHPADPRYEFSGQYLCSPSIVRHNGNIYVSMDVYKAGAPQNLSLLFCSRDDGKTFSYVTDLFPCFWGTLFSHNGCLYMIGTSTEYGDLLIGCSRDDGKTWEGPAVLYRGAGNVNQCGIHKAPVPVLEHDGRVWIAVEWGTWNRKCFMSGAFSAPSGGDLINAANWTCTGFLRHDANWPGAKPVFGGLEGNLVAQNGRIFNMLRYATGTALVLELDPRHPERLPQFARVTDCPAAHAKFEIRQYGNRYYMVGNRLPLRNILSLYESSDLCNWRLLADVVNCVDMPEQEVGFQYPAFFMEGDTIYIVSRTAVNGAANFHDTNSITFHKITVSKKGSERI